MDDDEEVMYNCSYNMSNVYVQFELQIIPYVLF